MSLAEMFNLYQALGEGLKDPDMEGAHDAMREAQERIGAILWAYGIEVD
jgi:hypothetical protein